MNTIAYCGFKLSSIGAKAFHSMIGAAVQGIKAGHWTKEEAVARVAQNVPEELADEVGIAAYIDVLTKEDAGNGK